MKLHKPKASDYYDGWLGFTICMFNTAAFLIAAILATIAAFVTGQWFLLGLAFVCLFFFSLVFYSQFIYEGKTREK